MDKIILIVGMESDVAVEEFGLRIHDFLTPIQNDSIKVAFLSETNNLGDVLKPWQRHYRTFIGSASDWLEADSNREYSTLDEYLKDNSVTEVLIGGREVGLASIEEGGYTVTILKELIQPEEES